MIVFVKYFGLIKDETHVDEEFLELNLNMSLTGFIEETLFIKYPSLNKIDFRVAVNNEICDNNHQISDEDKLSILPFFSGG
jgi:molybdopterin converting factor small subunit